MIDSKGLLADLQEQVRKLETDLAGQLVEVPGLSELLNGEWTAERRARRTATAWPAWRGAQLTQIAVAWVLGTVFLRWSEDNELIDPVLAGPGDRLAIAEDKQLEHYRRHPEHNDGDWLAEQFEVLRTTDAGRLLFDPDHNPMYWVPISHDAAKALVAFWRAGDGETLRHDFRDPTWDTRFLGDLYQDLSEDAKRQYDLLQTPRFVEAFIIAHTLSPAVEHFGLSGLRVIDPACGSGHFLLGAFARLVEAWRQQVPTLTPYELARRSLDSIHGVDVNPYAVAIARFRLLIATLKVAGITTFSEAASHAWRPLVACGDSLKMIERQESFSIIDEGVGYRTRWEDWQDFADVKLLSSGSYHAVIGNPPYGSVDDDALREEYRSIYGSCFGKYTLAVPFVERFFDLSARQGFVGQITSSSFMKRKFGKRLVEQFLPRVHLTHVVDSSGIPIPGAGVTTVMLFGRGGDSPRSGVVRVLARVKGEPGRAPGPAWRAIEGQFDGGSSESQWVAASDVPEGELFAHPWILATENAKRLLRDIRGSNRSLSSLVAQIGMSVFPGEDEAFILPACGPLSRRLRRFGRPVVIGDDVRDFIIAENEYCIVPPQATLAADHDLHVHFWPMRSILRRRLYFGKLPHERGLRWFDLSLYFENRNTGSLSLTFAAMATHPSFAIDDRSSVFKQSSPVIKLKSETNDDYLAAVCLLNSSTVAFWLRQTCHPYGSGAGKSGERKATVAWDNFFDYSATRIEDVPIPDVFPTRPAVAIFRAIAALQESRPNVSNLLESGLDVFAQLRVTHSEALGMLIYNQEELDWAAYVSYGLLSDREAAETSGKGMENSLKLGERAFEIILARQVAAGEVETQWFARHDSNPITELPQHWSSAYRRVVEARIALIERRRDLALVESPECKRRWSVESWDKQRERALRLWLLDRLEARGLWFAPDVNGDDQPIPRTVRTLTDELQGDKEFLSVAALWAGDVLGRPDAEPAEIVGELIDAEHVPFLAAYRYKRKGLEKRAEWERTWELQRQEDAIVARLGFDDVTHKEVRRVVKKEIGEVPVPPKYAPAEFLRGSYWSQRDKFDVPKERFVSYPAASRDGDGSLLLGWAGWDHREQAQALAVLITQRRSDDGWSTDRVEPLLAGLAEVLPWVRQWHGEIDPRYGASPADIYDGFLDAQLGELHLSREQLAAWRPTGRVDVAPMPRSVRGRATASFRLTAAARGHRAPDPEHLDAVLTAAADGPLSKEQIRGITGLEAAGARALAQHLVADGRLVTSGQRRGMRYLLP